MCNATDLWILIQFDNWKSEKTICIYLLKHFLKGEGIGKRLTNCYWQCTLHTLCIFYIYCICIYCVYIYFFVRAHCYGFYIPVSRIALYEAKQNIWTVPYNRIYMFVNVYPATQLPALRVTKTFCGFMGCSCFWSQSNVLLMLVFTINIWFHFCAVRSFECSVFLPVVSYVL